LEGYFGGDEDVRLPGDSSDMWVVVGRD